MDPITTTYVISAAVDAQPSSAIDSEKSLPPLYKPHAAAYTVSSGCGFNDVVQ